MRDRGPAVTDHAKSADERKTKRQLVRELTSLREKVADTDRLLAELIRNYKEAPIGFCHLDTDLRFIHINDWLAAINGVPIEEHLGRTVREVLQDVAEGVEPQLRHVIETGEPILGGTVEAETPAGPRIRRTFRHNYYPLKSGDATVVGVSCVVEDPTERKRAEDALRQASQRQHEAFYERAAAPGVVVAPAAHQKCRKLRQFLISALHGHSRPAGN